MGGLGHVGEEQLSRQGCCIKGTWVRGWKMKGVCQGWTRSKWELKRLSSLLLADGWAGGLVTACRVGRTKSWKDPSRELVKSHS